MESVKEGVGFFSQSAARFSSHLTCRPREFLVEKAESSPENDLATPWLRDSAQSRVLILACNYVPGNSSLCPLTRTNEIQVKTDRLATAP